MNNIIHIYWQGPLTFTELPDDEKSDYGVYQIYGNHPVYGNDTLLYIGQTEMTFKQRLSREAWHWSDNHSNIKYYLGRFGKESINLPIVDLLRISEKMLVLSHAPSYNASGVQSNLDDLGDYRIFNWASYKMLLPEISTERYLSKYWDSNKYGKGTILK